MASKKREAVDIVLNQKKGQTHTLQGTQISPLWKRKMIFNSGFWKGYVSFAGAYGLNKGHRAFVSVVCSTRLGEMILFSSGSTTNSGHVLFP